MKLLGVLVAVLAVGGFDATRGHATQGNNAAAFDVRCGQYNYCTFTSRSGQNGTWEFSDWKFWGGVPVSGVSYTRPLSTHSPENGTTPYTTVIVHRVGAAVDTGFVRCDAVWDVRGMCRKVNR